MKRRSIGCVGIRNHGNTCYLNSVLQSLVSLNSFTNFLDTVQVSNTSFHFIRDLNRCMHDLLPDSKSNRICNTKPIIRQLKAFNSSFSDYQQQDAEEFLQMVMAILTKYLKQREQEVFCKLLKSGFLLLKSNDSLEGLQEELCRIHAPSNNNPFLGWLNSEVTCHDCGFRKPVRHEGFVDVHLTIPPLASTTPYRMSYPPKMSSIANMNTRIQYKDSIDDISLNTLKWDSHRVKPLSPLMHDISLEDCLRYYFRRELLQDIECENCSQFAKKIIRKCPEMIKVRDGDDDNSHNSFDEEEEEEVEEQAVVRALAWRVTSVSRAPIVLCLHLHRQAQSQASNRFRMVKLRQKVLTPLSIDLGPHLQYYPLAACECMYDLCAVIVHIGSADSGHYIAYRRLLSSDLREEKTDCGTSVLHRWLQVSDESVKEVRESDVLAAEAYLLFYERR